jgi:NAD(P)-dependent dehydrogenase (short-subunit alcohol dehydrogenase family)
MGQLQGKVAIVTGSNVGIGKGIAEVFAKEGAKVVINGRRKEVAESVAASIRADGGEALAVPADVTKEPEVIALFEKTLAAWGKVNILVNNAGMATRTPTWQMSLEMWQSVVDLNLTAAFLCSREAFKTMKDHGGGRIINIGSISAQTPRPNAAPYAATKMAIEGLTRSLTLDGRPFNIVSSVIHPGPTASNFNAARGGPGPGETPADFIMYPHDIGRLATLMCSLPDEVNLFSSIILPNHMPSFIGRG